MNYMHGPLKTLAMICLTTAASASETAPVSDLKRSGSRHRGWRGSRRGSSRRIDAGVFSGAVAASACNGKVAYLQAVGFRDRAKTIPLQPDAIF